MKKTIFFLIMVICLFCLCGNIFAQDFSKLNDDLLAYSETGLSLQDNRIPTGLAIFLNILPGFGVGSYLIKDNLRGGAQLVCEIMTITNLITTLSIPSTNYYSLFSSLISYSIAKIIGIAGPLNGGKQIKPVPAFLLNLVFGFGLGSIFQNDLIFSVFSAFDFSFSMQLFMALGHTLVDNTIIYVGLIGLISSRVLSLLAPFCYRENPLDTPAWWVGLINFVAGFGVGSNFIWKDRIGFISQVIIEGIGGGIGAAVSVAGLFALLANLFEPPIDMTWFYVGLSVGGGIMVIGRIYGFIRAFVFKAEQQKSNNETNLNNNNNNNETISSEEALVLPIFSITPEGEIILGISIAF